MHMRLSRRGGGGSKHDKNKRSTARQGGTKMLGTRATSQLITFAKFGQECISLWVGILESRHEEVDAVRTCGMLLVHTLLLAAFMR